MLILSHIHNIYIHDLCCFVRTNMDLFGGSYRSLLAWVELWRPGAVYKYFTYIMQNMPAEMVLPATFVTYIICIYIYYMCRELYIYISNII